MCLNQIEYGLQLHFSEKLTDKRNSDDATSIREVSLQSEFGVFQPDSKSSYPRVLFSFRIYTNIRRTGARGFSVNQYHWPPFKRPIENPVHPSSMAH